MKFNVETNGRYDFINITRLAQRAVEQGGLVDGLVMILALHTTCAITIMEWEEGIKQDIAEALEKLAPQNSDYKHHLRWGDRNGAAHIKSALMKPALTLPFEKSKMCLGQWQQIVLIDFDEKPRVREILINCYGPTPRVIKKASSK